MAEPLLRLATAADVPALRALIDASIRGLGSRWYDAVQVDSSLRHLFGVDSLLLADETYYVVEVDGRMAGSGGWSRRRTPFGGDQATGVQDAVFRDPTQEPAVIRAFYVHPDFARQGIGQQLLVASEAAAHAAGFRTLALVATLSGVAFYAACGYREVEPIDIPLPDGVVIGAVRMVKP